MPVLRRQLENPLRDRVCHDARLLGVRSLQLDLRHDAGWPDRIFLTPYIPLWLEFKRPGEVPRPLQQNRLDILNSLSYNAGFVDSYSDAMELIETALTRKRR
jgi:hypothetical protein